MPRIVTAQNLPTVSRSSGRAARIPTIQAPAAGLADIGGAAVELGIRIKERREGLDRDAADTEFSSFLSQQALDLQEAGDLAKEETITAAMAAARNERTRILSQHSGGGTSRTLLQNAMDRRLSAHAALLGRLNVDAAVAQTEASFQQRLNAVVATTAMDTSVPLSESFSRLENELALLAPRPDQERAFRMLGQEEIALSRVDRYLSLGRSDLARELMDDPQYDAVFTPAVRRKAVTAIDEAEGALRKARLTGEAYRVTASVLLGEGASEDAIKKTALELAGVDGGQNLHFVSSNGVVIGLDPTTGEVRSRVQVGPRQSLDHEKIGNDIVFFDAEGNEKSRIKGKEGQNVEAKVVGDTLIVYDPDTGEEINRIDETPDRFEIIDAAGVKTRTGLDIPSDFVIQRNLRTEEMEILINPASGSTRDQKINDYRALGAPEDLAVDLADGNARMTVTPNGETIFTNTRTGEAMSVTLQPSPEQAAAMTEATQRRSEIGTPSARQMVEEQDVVGLGAGITELSIRTVGQFIPFGEESRKTVRYRQTISALENSLLTSLAQNPKYPESQLQRIRKGVNIAPSAFNSREAFLSQLDSVAQFVAKRAAENDIKANDPGLSGGDRADWRAASIDMKNFLDSLGYDLEGQPVQQQVSEPMVEGIAAPGSEVPVQDMSDEELMRQLGIQ